MRIEFPPVDDNFIKNQIAGGYYHNATELVRDAVRRLRENAEGHNQNLLYAALRQGMDDTEFGRTTPYTPQLLNDIEQDAITHAKAGRKPNPDVVS